MIITIAGAPCSGKTTLAHALVDVIGPTSCVAPDVFAAYCARHRHAPPTEDARMLWNRQVSVNLALGAGFDLVLCAGAPWATNSYQSVRGHDVLGIPDSQRLGTVYYDGVILLSPLPWVSDRGRAEEPDLDRARVRELMHQSIEESGQPYVVIYSSDPQERLNQALRFLGYSHLIREQA